MAGLIPRAFIDQVLAMTDLVVLIDERVPLKKTGKNFSACCPFHSEKTPSFNVNPGQQFYHCFGCGQSGNAISFLIDFDRLDFVSAIEYLARLHGLIIPEEAKEHQTTVNKAAKMDAYDTLQRVAACYQQQLKTTAVASDYLKARGVSGEIAKCYGVGFAPDAWRFLSQQLPNSENVLRETGLLIEKDDKGFYDRFRGRIMFPIRDARGRVIAFGGRILTDEQPKYLNSPETPYFHKGRELYGLYEARLANRELTEVVVVEGYLDVLALAQFGIRNAVATLGTATSTDHIEKLSRVTPCIIFCFDGDKAGRTAAWRALQNALPVLKDTVSVKFLFLPDGTDPDSYVRQQGAAAFQQLMQEAQPLSSFLYKHVSEDCALTTAEGKAQLVDKAMVLLRQIPRSTLRDLLLDELVQLSKMPRRALQQLLQVKANTQASDEPFENNTLASLKSHRLLHSPMRVAIHLLLALPALIKLVNEPDFERLQQLTLPGAPLLQALLTLCRANPAVTCGALLESFREQAEFSVLRKLTAQNSLDLDEAALMQEWLAVLKKLFSLEQDQKIHALHQLMRERSLTLSEKTQLMHLLKNSH